MPPSFQPTSRTYRIAAWATAALAFVTAVLAFGFGLAAVVGPAPPPGDEQVTAGPRPEPGPPISVLARDQSEVTGTITKLVGTNIVAPPLALPLTLNVVRGGGTKAEFSGGAVSGKNATITWDGGRPLPLRGTGSIDLNGPVNVDVSPTGATWKLDGASRLLTPGSYTMGAAVAVVPVNGDLGVPRESAKLDVPAGAAASLLTHGDVRTTTPPAALSLRGPGQLVIEGALEVKTRDSVRQATKITFGIGAFEIDLEPQPGGYRLSRAFLQGPTTLEP